MTKATITHDASKIEKAGLWSAIEEQIQISAHNRRVTHEEFYEFLRAAARQQVRDNTATVAEANANVNSIMRMFEKAREEK